MATADRVTIKVWSNRGRRLILRTTLEATFHAIMREIRVRSVRPERQPRLFFRGREAFAYQLVTELGFRPGQEYNMVCDVEFVSRNIPYDRSDSETDEETSSDSDPLSEI